MSGWEIAAALYVLGMVSPVVIGSAEFGWTWRTPESWICAVLWPLIAVYAVVAAVGEILTGPSQ